MHETARSAARPCHWKLFPRVPIIIARVLYTIRLFFTLRSSCSRFKNRVSQNDLHRGRRVVGMVYVAAPVG